MDSFSSTPEEQWKASKVSLPESTMAALKGEKNRKQCASTIPLLVLCLSYMPLLKLFTSLVSISKRRTDNLKINS